MRRKLDTSHSGTGACSRSDVDHPLLPGFSVQYDCFLFITVASWTEISVTLSIGALPQTSLEARRIFFTIQALESAFGEGSKRHSSIESALQTQ